MNEATYKVTEIIFMFLVPSAGLRLRQPIWMKHFYFLIWFQYLPNIGNDDVNITAPCNKSRWKYSSGKEYLTHKTQIFESEPELEVYVNVCTVQLKAQVQLKNLYNTIFI